MDEIWTRKPVDRFLQDAEGPTGLRRSLGPWHLMALGLGAVIGAGIFIITGQAAAQYAGPAIVISFLLAGLAAAFAGLCYAEFASLLPVSGSAYSYTYATLGEILAWIIGWDLMLEYLFGGAVIAAGWSGYAVDLLRDHGFHLPASLAAAPLALNEHTGLLHWNGGLVNLPAMLVIGLLTLILLGGARESAGANNAIVVVKLLVILAFVAFGAQYLHPANWSPFIPPNAGEFGHYGWSGILRGAGVVFYAYIGFDAVSTAAQEARRPQTDMPVGILGALVVATVLYVLVALVLTGLVPYHLLNVPEPIALGVQSAGPGLAWLKLPVELGALAGLTSGMLVVLYGQTRILYTMSRDGLLPPLFGRVHPTRGVPVASTLLVGGCCAVAAGFLPLDALAELVSIGTLLAFALVCGGVLMLRYREPDRPRPFRTPLVPFVPVAGILVSLYLMAGLPATTWLRLFVWMGLGFVVYFTYGRRHSALRRS